MATIDDLGTMLTEDASVREDLLSTLAAFFQRHNITVTPADIVGVNDEVKGYLAGAFQGGNFGGGPNLSPTFNPTAGGRAPLGVVIYRDGPNYSRLYDSGIVSTTPR